MGQEVATVKTHEGRDFLIKTLAHCYMVSMMPAMTRRQFMQKTALATAAVLATPTARADSTEHSIEILLEEPIGRISPDLYGHFTEHIGGVIYDGIWVGENSKIPNEGGIRKQLIEAMRQL